MRSLSHAGRVVLAALPAFAAVAQQPEPGQPAPPIDAAAWLNTAGETPTLESLRGRVVMIEFWGTWCGPCVRAMPEVQKLHERYADRGLTVLAISYETPEKMRPFLEEHAYTMPVGSDPEKKIVAAYGIKSWPTTFVIDKEGVVAHVGSPYDAEAAVERALGLESSPATLLTLWLDATKGDEDGQREALTRLLEKAPADFDLRAWARANGGAEAAVAEGEGGAELTEASAKTEGTVDGGKLLAECAVQWRARDDSKLVELLRTLGRVGPTEYDLSSFVRSVYGDAFPLDRKELQELLKQNKLGEALDAIALRNPPRSALTAAARHKGLQTFCANKLQETRTLAKKAIMVQSWLFAGVQPTDNEGFWRELAVSGIATSEDRKQIIGVMIGGARVSRAMAEGFIRDHLARAVLMESLASGKAPQLRGLDERIEKERAEILEPLEKRYGPTGGKKK